jgi:hypothetical protein
MKRPAPAKISPPRLEDPLAYFAPAPYIAQRTARAVAPMLAVDLMYAYYGTE